MAKRKSSAPAARRLTAKESRTNCADSIGKPERGMSLFIVNRGQWSMVDAVLHFLESAGGACRLSIWSWTIADHDAETLARLAAHDWISSAVLVIDYASREKHAAILSRWRDAFGAQSIRWALNHAKISTVEWPTGERFLLRGSMNLNHNTRFEQLDITEGGEDFELVRKIEAELPGDEADGAAIYAATVARTKPGSDTASYFPTPKTWKPNG